MNIPRPIVIPQEPSQGRERSPGRGRARSPANRRTPKANSRSPLGHSTSPSARLSPLVGSGSHASLMALIDGSRSIDSVTNYDLIDAVNNGNTKHVNHVIDSLILTTIINGRDSRGMTPLHLASKKGHEDVAVNLLHRGADLHLADKMGWTPLFWACMEGHVNIAQMLIKRGADPSGLDNGKATCLHYAAMEGHIEVVRLLIDSGVDISIKDHINQSPVQAACVHGHEECALELMERGADFTLPDGMDASNLSPLAQACLLFCEDFGFEPWLKKKTYRDAQTWTKEDGVLDILSSDSEVSGDEETPRPKPPGHFIPLHSKPVSISKSRSDSKSHRDQRDEESHGRNHNHTARLDLEGELGGKLEDDESKSEEVGSSRGSILVIGEMAFGSAQNSLTMANDDKMPDHMKHKEQGQSEMWPSLSRVNSTNSIGTQHSGSPRPRAEAK